MPTPDILSLAPQGSQALFKFTRYLSRSDKLVTINKVCFGSQQFGFTVVELVMTLVIVGILAAVAIPRYFVRSDFDARVFSDQTLSILRYAQKSAIAQRRTVCVTFSSASTSPSTIDLTITPNFAQTGPCVPQGAANRNDYGLTGPDGSKPYSITASSGISFSSASPATYPVNFTFNPLGQASIGQTIQVSGAPNVITIEQDTGYVH